MNDYRKVSWLAVYHLEESYVLDIQASPGLLAVEADLALHVDHPQHRPALPGERHCYLRGTLQFSQVVDLHWVDQGAPPAKDASGELDYGTVDSLEVDGDLYIMTGDFGRISVTASKLSIRLHD
ncbi:hypothetical protein [Streptomyces sp. NPDC020298]|uniref:hypothetical protein n=1 Tax=unclassified Streptomyces TaxID=2593676 RepID=UPI0033D4FD18